MAVKKKKESVMICQRCGTRMHSAKFYDKSNAFFAWTCAICGEVIDPVILLHRLTKNANIPVPERTEDIMYLVKKYMKTKNRQSQKGDHEVTL